MAIEFNDRAVRALKTDRKRQDFRIDTGSEKGLVISVYPNKSKRWRYIYKVEGTKRVLTLGEYPAMGLAKAKEDFIKYRNQVKLDGKDPAKEQQDVLKTVSRQPTVEWLASEYIKRWAKPRKRSWKEDQRILDKDVLPVWGKRKAQDITRRDVIVLLDSIVDRGAPIMANKIHAVLHKMFRFAVGRDAIPFNPVADMPKPAKVRKRDRVLTDAEISTHWHGLATIGVTTTTALLFQLLTAQRSGEVAAMRWDEIDGDVWTIPAEKAKNGLAHRVPLSLQAQAILDGLPKDSDAVFGIIHTAAGKTLARYLKRLGITKDDSEWFTPHDLRRTAATNMTKAGYNRLIVSKVLNHTEGGVTAIYDRHSYDKEKRQALEAWGRKLYAILNKAEGDDSKVVNLR